MLYSLNLSKMELDNMREDYDLIQTQFGKVKVYLIFVYECIKSHEYPSAFRTHPRKSLPCTKQESISWNEI